MKKQDDDRKPRISYGNEYASIVPHNRSAGVHKNAFLIRSPSINPQTLLISARKAVLPVLSSPLLQFSVSSAEVLAGSESGRASLLYISVPLMKTLLTGLFYFAILNMEHLAVLISFTPSSTSMAHFTGSFLNRSIEISSSLLLRL